MAVDSNEIYQRLLPALNAKVDELKRMKVIIDPVDIWNYCVTNIWNKKEELRMYELVNDILQLDASNIIKTKKESANDNW